MFFSWLRKKTAQSILDGFHDAVEAIDAAHGVKDEETPEATSLRLLPPSLRLRLLPPATSPNGNGTGAPLPAIEEKVKKPAKEKLS